MRNHDFVSDGFLAVTAASRWTDLGIHAGGECWDRLAKWPDGTRLDDWDLYFNDAPAGSSNERDQWRELLRQKLKVCEYAKPLVQRSTAWLDEAIKKGQTSCR